MTSKSIGTVHLVMQPSVRPNGELPVLTPLAQHGTVKVMLATGASPTRTPDQCLSRLQDVLANDFNPATDYFAWAGGDPLALVLLGIAIESEQLDGIRWLRYHKPVVNGQRSEADAYYTPVGINLTGPTPTKSTDPRQLNFLPQDDKTT